MKVNNVSFQSRLLIQNKSKDFDQKFYDDLAKIAEGIGSKKDIIVMDDFIRQGIGSRTKFYRNTTFNHYNSGNMHSNADTYVIEEVKGDNQANSMFWGRSAALTLENFKQSVKDALYKLEKEI